jgi:serine/threonine-protein kinase
MAISEGTRFGPYEIVAKIGAGGMGEVYRATDTNLKRDVAVKILPESFAKDKDRLARFQREAEILASLNHPNIATIHGLEQAGDQTVIVMELVEGPTLADRIVEGPISSDEAMRIALQVAAALEAAHGKHIVHRDLKPANVKLKDDGTVKVLDFGISKPIDASAISGGPALRTTPAVTQTGVILGTAAYMSPEQARGKLVDERTDIWAFGCLLFEMLTGQPAFVGEDVMATLARVIDRDTDLSSMPGTISPAVRNTIKLCLEKSPNRRISDIRDVRLALEGVFESQLPRTAGTASATPLWRRALPVAAAIGVTSAVVGLGAWLTLQPEPRAVVRFDYDLPEGQLPRNIVRPIVALSPDGRRFAYNTTGGIYVRELSELEARLIPGTEEALVNPFFSPDGRSVGYVGVDGRLKRIAISGGAPVVVAEGLDNVFGVSWGSDGVILIGQPEGILRVSANGGEPELVIAAHDDEMLYGPSLLPDGDTLLFTSGRPPNWDTAQIVAESLSTGERTVLVAGGSDARYVPSGHLVYALDDGLFAVAFDAENLAVSGGPAPLLQGLFRSPGLTAASNYGLADDGTLIYFTSDATTADLPGPTLTWVDHGGNEETIGMEPCAGCVDLSLSPDGTRAALTVLRGGDTAGADVWIWTFESSTLSRLTFESQIQVFPAWSPDSRRIAYRTLEGLFSRPSDGTGAQEQLLEVASNAAAYDLSAESELIFVQQTSGGASQDVLVLDLSAEGPPRTLLATAFDEARPALSPDGRWIAYESDETGQREIYVRPYPDVDTGKWQVSTNGGSQPIWSPDNGTLYFLSADQLMAAEVETDPTFRRRTPQALFGLDGFQIAANSLRNYDISADGERFLMMKTGSGPAATPGTSRVVVVQNWVEELKRLVPTK